MIRGTGNAERRERGCTMKRVMEVLTIVLAGLVLGVGSGWWVIHYPPTGRAVWNGPWITNPMVGSSEAGMYVRAVVAHAGLFALNRTETIYFTAFADSGGEPLRAECDYVVEGGDMDARWWSITAYGQDHFLIPNAQNRHSFHIKNVRRDGQGRYRIRLSGEPAEGDWLPTGGSGRISLTLRLYNPSPSVHENLETTPLPRIVKEGCP